MGPESVTAALNSVAEGLRLVLESLSVLTVLVGVLCSLGRCWPALRRRRPPPPLSAIRLQFGSWLSLALEFQLGADIVATTASPNRDNLIQLATVAVIRTGLNVFLTRELEASRHDPG
jgi:uncharacterized membrane protein